MYTVQYRFRENGRLTKWFYVSEHNTISQARKALAAHIAEFSSMNARLITRDGKTLGHYQFTGL